MIWIFVILGLVALMSVLHGLATLFGVRRSTWLLHGAALVLVAVAWSAGHVTLLGWASLLFACVVELLLRLPRKTDQAQPSLIEQASAGDSADAAVAATGTAASLEASPAGIDDLKAGVLSQLTAGTVPEAQPGPAIDGGVPAQAGPPAPPFTTWVLLQRPWEAAGDVFFASLRRGGLRDAELRSKSPQEPLAVHVGAIDLHVTSESRRAPQSQLDYAAAQSWDWPDAASAISAHTAHVLLTTRTTVDTPRLDVVRLHCRAQAALAEFAPVVAVVWPDAGRLLPVSALSEPARSGQEVPSATASCINFRLFPFTEQASAEQPVADQAVGEPSSGGQPADRYVSDSVGLHAFGLPDVQVCTDGEPNEQVSAVLYQMADRIFAEGWAAGGDAILDLGELGRWQGARTPAFFAPEREVINLTPVSAKQ